MHEQDEGKRAERVFGIADLAPFTGGKSRPTIYKWIHAGTFPRPARMGPNTVAWRESDLVAWQQGRFAADDALVATKSVRAANAARRSRAAQRHAPKATLRIDRTKRRGA
jgi:prophage regulatory protein